MVDQANQISSNQPELTTNDFKYRLGWLLVALLSISLACSFAQPAARPVPTRVVTRTPLPTFTPTPNPAEVAAVSGHGGQPAGANLAPTTTNTPRPTFTPTSAVQPVNPNPNPAEPAETNPNPSESGAATPTPTLNNSGAPVPPPTSLPTPIAAETATPVIVADAPTPTPTPTATQTTANTPNAATPTETASPTVEATVAPTNSPTPQSGNNGWAFASVKVYPDLIDYGLILYGDIINNTGSTQLIDYVTGTFYNEQGQVIADDANTLDDWATSTLPAGGRMPFVLTVEDINSAARYELRVESEPGDENPRQNFEFLNSTGNYDGDLYCVRGELRNPGGALESYLTIAAIIFDAGDQVINYDIFDEYFPEDIVGSETLEFEICIDQPNQNVARFELRAWGE